MRTTVAFVLACTATIALTGCGTGTAATGSSSTSSVTSTAAAASTTVASSTAATTSTSTTPTSTPAPKPGSVVSGSALGDEMAKALARIKSFQVATNMDGGDMTMTVSKVDAKRTDLAVKSSQDGYEMRVIDEVVYLKMAGGGRRPWIKVSESDMPGGSEQSMMSQGSGAMATMASPTLQNEALAKGRTTFVGVEHGSRHYRSSVPGSVYTDLLTEHIAKNVPMSSADASSMSSEMGADSRKYAKATLYIDTWIGADGLPTRYSLDGTELSKLDDEPDGPDVITLRYSKWNAVPAIVAPPASQVGTMPDMGDSATGSGSAGSSSAR